MLEAQAPRWEPGSHLGYHAITFGHLVGEVIRRATGRTVGQTFREEMVEPLALQAWIGLPEDAHPDLARLERTPVELPEFVEELIGPGTSWSRAMTFGSALPHDLVTGVLGDFNDRRVLAVELPAANMVTDARSFARLYAATVCEVDGARLLAPSTIDAAHRVQTAEVPFFGWPESLADFKPMNFALGFQVMPVPVGPTSFGHGGAGGSLAFADIEHRIGFGYAMNRMDASSPDTRAVGLVAAVRASLDVLREAAARSPRHSATTDTLTMIGSSSRHRKLVLHPMDNAIVHPTTPVQPLSACTAYVNVGFCHAPCHASTHPPTPTSADERLDADARITM